jgi:uncharacterized membrane protein YbhN (UPF0104 family)
VKPSWAPRSLALVWRVAWLGAGSGLLVVVLSRAVSSSREVAAAGSVELPLLFLALLPAWVAPVAHAWRWKRMLAAIDEPLTLGPALRATIAATLAHYAVPGYAWAPVKGLLAKRIYGIGLVRSAPTLVLEQGLDMGMLVAGAGLGVLLMPSLWVQVGLRLPERPTGIVLFAGVALLGLVLVWHRERWRSALGTLALNGQRLLCCWTVYPWLVGSTVVRWAADLASFWLVATGLGLDLSGTQLLVLATFPALAGVVTPVPGGLGVREGSVLAVGSALGLAGGPLALAALAHRVVLLGGLLVAFASTRLLPRSP